MPTQFAAQLTMAKISIKRRKDFERADGRAPLYAVFNIKGEKIRIPVEIAVTAAEWDEDAEQIRGRSSDVKDKNLIISNVRSKISDIFVRARLSGESITKASVLAMYRQPDDGGSFISYAFRHLEELKDGLQPETIRHHKAALKKLEAHAPNLRITGQAESTVHMLNWAIRSVKFLGVEFDQSEDEEVAVPDTTHL